MTVTITGIAGSLRQETFAQELDYLLPRAARADGPRSRMQAGAMRGRTNKKISRAVMTSRRGRVS
jgi:hypothetical protein